MKFFIVLSAILMPILATYDGNVQVTHDTHGNYHLKYNTLDASREEQRFYDGRVVGRYTFVDTDGHHHTVNYVSGADEGFQASGASIPVASLSVPEPLALIHARQEHLTAYAKVASAVPYYRTIAEHPVPVHEVLARLNVPRITSFPRGVVPEVDAKHYAIKSDLARSYADALERLAKEYRSRQ